MKTQLLLLEEHLKSRLNSLYRELQAPLLNDEIIELEQRFKVELPLSIKKWYRWKNGQAKESQQPFLNYLSYFSLSEMLELYTNNINGFQEGQYPLFGNRTGRYRSFICFDTYGLYRGHKGEIFRFNCSEPFDEDLAESLETLTENINDYLTTVPDRKLKDTIYLSPKRTIRPL